MIKRIIGLLLVFLLPQLFVTPLLAFLHEYCLGTMAFGTIVAESMVISFVLSVSLLFLFRWVRCADFRKPGVSRSLFYWTLLWMLPLIYLVNILLEFLGLEDYNVELIQSLMHHPLGLLAMVLTGPVLEELVFRKGVFGSLMEHGVSPERSIFISALLFGVVHANPVQILGGFLFGIVLGWLYWRSGTIWLPCAAHVFNNLFSVVMAKTTGMETTFVSLLGGLLPTLFLTAVALVLAWWIYRRLVHYLPPSSVEVATNGEG